MSGCVYPTSTAYLVEDMTYVFRISVGVDKSRYLPEKCIALIANPLWFVNTLIGDNSGD